MCQRQQVAVTETLSYPDSMTTPASQLNDYLLGTPPWSGPQDETTGLSTSPRMALCFDDITPLEQVEQVRI